MNEENLIGGMTALFLSGTMEFISPLRWFFVLASSWYWQTCGLVLKQPGSGKKRYG